MENKAPSDMYWRVQAVCVKVQADSSLELPLKHNQDQMSLMSQGWLWPFWPSEISYSLKFLLEWKMGKELPESSRFRVLRKVFSKQFSFIRCRRQGRYIRFTIVENTINNAPKVLRVKFRESDGLLCFISRCTFGSFKNLFPSITSFSELSFWFRRFI